MLRVFAGSGIDLIPGVVALHAVDGPSTLVPPLVSVLEMPNLFRSQNLLRCEARSICLPLFGSSY